MIYMTGSKGPAVLPHLDSGALALLNTPNSRYTLGESWTWAADNAAYSAATYPGDDAWLAWLDTFTDGERSRCMFATAPDVVGDHEATLARSLPWLPVIRSLGYKAAFVLQDGATVDSVPWDAFDVAFVGGSTAWKLGPDAKTLIAEALVRGKGVHVGRVNSQRRFLAFAALGCDSADGTYLAFGPETNLPKLLGWLEHDRTHAPLFEVTHG